MRVAILEIYKIELNVYCTVLGTTFYDFQNNWHVHQIHE